MVARRNLLHFLTIVFLVQLPSTTMAQTADVYAIYSALIAKSPVVRTGPGHVPTDDEIYLIEATTSTERSGYGPPGGRSLFTAESCMKAPPIDEVNFREILADYSLRKNSLVTLKRLFDLAKPYQLLPIGEVDRFLREALEATPKVRAPNVTPSVNRNPFYKTSRRVFRLGDVYFNKNQTLAVVFFSVYTTPSDATGSWRAFRKTANGQWQTNNSWATCTWSVSR
jgi:hypothetical protein